MSISSITRPAASEHRHAGIAAVLAATAFWSFGGVLAKSTHAEGIVVTFWRMWAASLVLGVVAFVRHEWPSWTDLRRSVFAGVLFGANIGVFFTALEHVTVANALVITALAPVLMLPIAVRVLGEHVTIVKVVCAVVAVAGVVVSVLAAPSGKAGSNDTLVGSVLAAAALVLWVGYLAVSKHLRATIDTVPFMLAVSFVGGLSVSALVVVQGSDLGEVHGAGWAWIVLLAVGPGIGGHGLMAWAQQRVDASVSTVLMQAEPVGASMAAYFILDERVGLLQMAAMGIVIVALCLLVYSESREIREVLTTPTS